MSWKSRVKHVIFIIFLGIFIYSTVMLGYWLIDKTLNNILNKQVVSIYDKSKIEQRNAAGNEKLIPEEDRRRQVMEPLLKINGEIVGWLNIANTRINYPVVRGKDNEFYLNHNIEKKSSKYGSVFMDYRNRDFAEFAESGKNIIIYGHNMRDGSMFGDLNLYKKEKFFRENQFINFDILGKQYKWQVFSAYVTNPGFNYIKTDFKNSIEFNKFLESIRQKSRYTNEVIADANDIILTLSTCSYEFKDARFVVHSKLIK
ncbi:MAG: class B sortase [Thermincola sp.]|nr:class B sortase [Thermincola sp.]MDT3702279.1 class B sortase [Thermincola sp.]